MTRWFRLSVFSVLALLVVSGSAQESVSAPDALPPTDAAGPFTLEQILAAPTAGDPVAAPAGAAVAWVLNEQGRRNVWVAEGPDWRLRALTSFSEDDGAQLGNPAWTPDGQAVVFTRGHATGTTGAPLNPASDAAGTTQTIWLAPLGGGPVRQLAGGLSPEMSPRGDRIAFLRGNDVWAVPVRQDLPPTRLFVARGQVDGMTWSPDGSALAFSIRRGAHTLLGVYHESRRVIEYVSPSVDRDLYPRWSPDGRSLAFVRMFNTETRMRSTGRFGPIDSQWALMVATRPGPNADFGAASEVWKAPAHPLGSFPRNVQFLDWVDGNRLVFASEHETWARLYVADPASPGSLPTLQTPGACDVHEVALGPNRRTLFFVSNCGDLERRHLWKVDVPYGPAGSAQRPQLLTPGLGVETAPAPTADGRTVIFLKGDARTPPNPHAFSLVDNHVSRIMPANLPDSFPTDILVEPTLAAFKAADGLEIHATVFAPPAGAGGPRLRHPALVHVHGGPTAGQELLGWQPLYQFYAAHGFVVLGLNYRGGAGYGRSFREFPSQGVAGAAEYQDVVAASDYLRSRPDVDPARIGIWGASYGGYLTQLALARNSDVFKAGVTECGIYDLAANARPTQAASRGGDAARIARESSPIGSIHAWTSPVLVIHGDDDAGVDFNLQTVALVQGLRARKVHVEQFVLPDEGHGSSLWKHALAVHQRTAEFFTRILGGRVPPS